MLLNAVRAETRKLTSTVMPWGFVALGLGLTAMNVFLSASGDKAPLADATFQRGLATSGATAGTFALILALVGMTSEDRHKTLTPSLLACPRRTAMIAAKMIAHALAGAVLTAAATILCWILIPLALSGHDVAVVLTAGNFTTILARGVLYGAVASVFGVAIGAVLRNQVAALIIAVLWFFLAETILTQMTDFGRYTPGAAAAAIAGPGALGAGGGTMLGLLGFGTALMLYLGYTAVTGIAGVAGLSRRDVS